MRQAIDSYNAMFGPVDGDDYTWDEMPKEESTQPWQEHIMERLAQLEADNAELTKRLARLEQEAKRLGAFAGRDLAAVHEMLKRYEGEL